MTYVQRILEPDERILVDGHLHWLSFMPSCLLMLLAAGAAAVLAVFALPLSIFWGPVLAVLFLIGLFRYLVLHAMELVVTDRRVILKKGFIARRTIEMNNHKIESVDVEQSLLGRLLDYGTVRVRGTGSGIEPFRMVDNPLAFRRAILSMSGS